MTHERNRLGVLQRFRPYILCSTAVHTAAATLGSSIMSKETVFVKTGGFQENWPLQTAQKGLCEHSRWPCTKAASDQLRELSSQSIRRGRAPIGKATPADGADRCRHRDSEPCASIVLIVAASWPPERGVLGRQDSGGAQQVHDRQSSGRGPAHRDNKHFRRMPVMYIFTRRTLRSRARLHSGRELGRRDCSKHTSRLRARPQDCTPLGEFRTLCSS
jgi:hypothetical protein